MPDNESDANFSPTLGSSAVQEAVETKLEAEEDADALDLTNPTQLEVGLFRNNCKLHGNLKCWFLNTKKNDFSKRYFTCIREKIHKF